MLNSIKCHIALGFGKKELIIALTQSLMKWICKISQSLVTELWKLNWRK